MTPLDLQIVGAEFGGPGAGVAMKTRCWIAAGTMALALAAVAVPASAAIIVDIDSASGAGTDVSLNRGTYRISFIDNRAAGGFDGFSFWNSSSGCVTSSNCQQGFANLFQVTVGGSTTMFIKNDPSAFYGYNLYDTAENALSGYQAGGVSKIVDGVDKGVSDRLFVAASGVANFHIEDGFRSDNRGGVSLMLTAVPEPASWALMVLGVGAVGGAIRRKRNALAVA